MDGDGFLSGGNAHKGQSDDPGNNLMDTVNGGRAKPRFEAGGPARVILWSAMLPISSGPRILWTHVSTSLTVAIVKP